MCSWYVGGSYSSTCSAFLVRRKEVKIICQREHIAHRLKNYVDVEIVSVNEERKQTRAYVHTLFKVVTMFQCPIAVINNKNNYNKQWSRNVLYEIICNLRSPNAMASSSDFENWMPFVWAHFDSSQVFPYMHA